MLTNEEITLLRNFVNPYSTTPKPVWCTTVYEKLGTMLKENEVATANNNSQNNNNNKEKLHPK